MSSSGFFQELPMNSQVPLPTFDAPPVAEVALSVQFEPLGSLRSVQLGLLWERFRDGYPRVEEHAPLEPVKEEFGARVPPQIGVKIETFDSPPVPRLWFLSQPGTE